MVFRAKSYRVLKVVTVTQNTPMLATSQHPDAIRSRARRAAARANLHPTSEGSRRASHDAVHARHSLTRFAFTMYLDGDFIP